MQRPPFLDGHSPWATWGSHSDRDLLCRVAYVGHTLASNDQGLFAARPFQPGQMVMPLMGERFRLAEIADFTIPVEVEMGEFLGPSGLQDDFVNHSCDPSCGVYLERSGVWLRAAKHIQPHEEITFDYSTTMVTDPTNFKCQCGFATCRHRVQRFHELPANVRGDYIERGMVPQYVINNLMLTQP